MAPDSQESGAFFHPARVSPTDARAAPRGHNTVDLGPDAVGLSRISLHDAGVGEIGGRREARITRNLQSARGRYVAAPPKCNAGEVIQTDSGASIAGHGVGRRTEVLKHDGRILLSMDAIACVAADRAPDA